MSLITCHECKEQISSEAAACPKCGAKPKRGIGALGIVAVAIVGLVAWSYGSHLSNTGPPALAPAKSAAEIQADRELNVAIAAGSVLKKSAKDPSSFTVESFVIFPGGTACYEYRAKNSFGAIVPAKAVFVPPDGLQTSELNGKAFVKSWNKVCTQSGGQERAGGLNLLHVW